MQRGVLLYWPRCFAPRQHGRTHSVAAGVSGTCTLVMVRAGSLSAYGSGCPSMLAVHPAPAHCLLRLSQVQIVVCPACN